MIEFYKMAGCGNDFVVLDFMKNYQQRDFALLARDMCKRRNNVGADGLIILMPSTIADCRMRIFNADGTEAQMCGNGIRCVAYLMYKQG